MVERFVTGGPEIVEGNLPVQQPTGQSVDVDQFIVAPSGGYLFQPA
jgi:hypothetical protein